MTIILDDCFIIAYDKTTQFLSHTIPLKNANIPDMLVIFSEKTPQTLEGGAYDITLAMATYFSDRHKIEFDFENFDYCFSAYQL